METRYPGNFNPTIELMNEELKSKYPKDFPRRSCMERLNKEELAIYEIIGEVEKLGSGVLLTEVTILLQQAKDKLADFIEQENLIYPDQQGYKDWCKKHNINRS